MGSFNQIGRSADSLVRAFVGMIETLLARRPKGPTTLWAHDFLPLFHLLLRWRLRRRRSTTGTPRMRRRLDLSILDIFMEGGALGFVQLAVLV